MPSILVREDFALTVSSSKTPLHKTHKPEVLYSPGLTLANIAPLSVPTAHLKKGSVRETCLTLPLELRRIDRSRRPPKTVDCIYPILGDPGAVSGGGTFLRPNCFLARLDFFPSPLTANYITPMRERLSSS